MGGEKMRYIQEISTFEYIEYKSLFIGILFPLDDPKEISQLILKAKDMYPKANHYCSASIYGDFGELHTADDNGEPSRTAGIPILEVLKHHDVTNILCVVVRYFGGIKLGASGLVRAYTKACAEVLKTATFYEKTLVSSYEIEFGYALIHTMDHLLEKKATILEKIFLENVTYKLVLTQLDSSFLTDMSYQLISLKEGPKEILWTKVAS